MTDEYFKGVRRPFPEKTVDGEAVKGSVDGITKLIKTTNEKTKTDSGSGGAEKQSGDGAGDKK